MDLRQQRPQHALIREASDIPGSIRIRNFNSDLCLDVAWGSSDDYAQLQQYHCTSNNPAQAFYQARVFSPHF